MGHGHRPTDPGGAGWTTRSSASGRRISTIVRAYPAHAPALSVTVGRLGRLEASRCRRRRRPSLRRRAGASAEACERCGRLDPCTPLTARTALRRLADEEFDVLVIGGGVTGAGVALDAASRGLRTALVEKGDFASGTSSKSSKMVHGGLRYLQQREFRLVYENLAERQRLLDNAPHLVSPLPFLIPLFGRNGAVSKAVARSYSSALWLYDVTGGWRIGERHKEVTRSQALGHLPTLNTEHLVAGFVYYDARADDARLTLTLARTGGIRVRRGRRQLHAGRRAHLRRRGPRHGSHGDARIRRRQRDRGAGPGGGQCLGGLGRRGPFARRGNQPALHPAGQGRARDGARPSTAVRRGRRHPGPPRPPLDLRRAMARDRPRVPRHHGHRLPGSTR